MLVAVSIGNLYALENLHGRQALNHALFVCAGRLRRSVPADVQVGRLFEDGFLLVSRNARDLDRLVDLGRTVAQRLSRPLMLHTGTGQEDGEAGVTPWAAQVGVGLLATTVSANAAGVVAKVRDMSRTAWSFASRVAGHDEASGAIAELPTMDPVR
jgi:GGDEF domain-containing protein